ncbi:MAG: hypothetical protein HYY23_06785 [Verrucomicrobia bacterium]|nr:hypothetical protein [Verrucomicrobiota bacterium]
MIGSLHLLLAGAALGGISLALHAGNAPGLPSEHGEIVLIGGELELGLAHLCEQKGCAAHLHKSLHGVPGVAGVRPRPSLDDPRATLFVQSGKAIDLWNLRQVLRDRSIEVRRLSAANVNSFAVQIELRRWLSQEAPQEPSQCLTCLARTIEAVRSLPWATHAASTEAGLRIKPGQPDVDLMSLMIALDRTGGAPAAVWLVPDGASLPPRTGSTNSTTGAAEPKRGGSEAHPLIQFDFDHDCSAGPDRIEVLNRQPWVSRSACAPANLGEMAPPRVLPGASHIAAIGDRQTADLLALLREWRDHGQVPKRIRLSGFGEIRIQCEFAHLCGEVEYSKPPKKEDKKAKAEKMPADNDSESGTKSDDSKQANNPTGGSESKKGAEESKKEDQPFVPQPLRPAPSSNSRQAIERALAKVDWIEKAAYPEYLTRPEFNGPRKLLLAFRGSAEQGIAISDLLGALTEAGFPPSALRVSRQFPGIAFGDPLPGDLELATPSGEKRLLSSFRRSGRALAVAFVSLNCPKWDKYKFEPDPKFYRQLKEIVARHRDRVEFVALSANPDDDFAKVGELLSSAELNIPLLRDATGQARAVLNAQITPAPHLYVFDSAGLLRYAGEAHDNWDKPAEAQKDFFSQALEPILSGKFAANNAVFFNSAKCNCSSPNCKCPKCGCGPSCRCDIKH